jgi:aquaporin Z
MDARKLAAEAFGTFMLVSSVLGAALFATAAPAVGLGVAVSIGLTVMALCFALGPVSGGHFNPAVTLGLVAAGRFDMSNAGSYIIAQCVGGILAAAVFFFLIGTGHAANLARVSNGWGTLSASNSGIISVFITEVVMTAFFLVVIVGVSASIPPAASPPQSLVEQPHSGRSGCSGWRQSSAACLAAPSATGWSRRNEALVGVRPGGYDPLPPPETR